MQPTRCHHAGHVMKVPAAADFPGMEQGRAPSKWLDREQWEARISKHTPTIDRFLLKVLHASLRHLLVQVARASGCRMFARVPACQLAGDHGAEGCQPHLACQLADLIQARNASPWVMTAACSSLEGIGSHISSCLKGGTLGV